jgi:hypothetical protein
MSLEDIGPFLVDEDHIGGPGCTLIPTEHHRAPADLRCQSVLAIQNARLFAEIEDKSGSANTEGPALMKSTLRLKRRLILSKIDKSPA